MLENTSEIVDREEIRRDFHGALHQQPDIGVARIIASWFLKPANIFDPNSQRKLKPDIFIVFGLFLFMAVICAAFNSR